MGDSAPCPEDGYRNSTEEDNHSNPGWDSSSLENAVDDSDATSSGSSAPSKPPPVLAFDETYSSGNGPPMTAEAYLTAVRAEAATLPSVFVADSAPAGRPQAEVTEEPSERGTAVGRRFSKHPDIEQPPAHGKPPSAWTDALLAAFRRIQSRIEQEALSCPRPRSERLDPTAWRQMCWDSDASAPSVSAVCALDQVHIIEGLRQYDYWLDKCVLSNTAASAGRQGPCLADVLLVGARSHWLFALLACLQSPILPDVSATLRSLLRKLCVERSQMKPDEVHQLSCLNVFIVLLAFHFGQDPKQELGGGAT